MNREQFESALRHAKYRSHAFLPEACDGCASLDAAIRAVEAAGYVWEVERGARKLYASEHAARRAAEREGCGSSRRLSIHGEDAKEGA